MRGKAALDGNRVKALNAECIGIARRRKEDVLSVGRPAGGDVGAGMKCDAPGIAARCGDDVNVQHAVVFAGERDPLAVRREMRAALDAWSGGEANRFAAIAAHFPEIVAKHEANVGAAQGGLAQQQRLIGLRETRARDQKCGQAKQSLLHRISPLVVPDAMHAQARVVLTSLRRRWRFPESSILVPVADKGSEIRECLDFMELRTPSYCTD